MPDSTPTSEERIAILWHAAFVQAVQTFGPTAHEDMTLDEGAAYEMTAEEVADFNAWNRERDFPAELADHLAQFNTYTHYLRLEGVTVTDDVEEFARFQTVDAWRAFDASR